MYKTIEVQGHFGPKQINREQFVKQWAETVGEAMWIARTGEDIETVQRARDSIAAMAGREFDRMLEKQENKA